MKLSETDSATLDILRLIMCLAVICLHAYTLDDKYDFLLDVLIVVTAYWVMRRIAPRILRIITGGRAIPS